MAIILSLSTQVVAESAPGDIVFKRAGNDESELVFPPSIFPHWKHRINYRCDACHDSLFEMKSGSTTVTMDLMDQGKVCGTCHNGNQAFAVTLGSCSRCHLSPED